MRPLSVLSCRHFICRSCRWIFNKYINFVYEHPEILEHLMKINEEFCVEWANAQFRAGSTAICYYDACGIQHNFNQRNVSQNRI
ncbi:uroporphyrinogen decarboxylase family protein [Desulfopila aestuarii]|uniref:uroporphyrinogen decarboxylase family protein n=1 Tax=Desulfopila aestuarii TaxID=231440 RepID=UPI0038992CBC